MNFLYLLLFFSTTVLADPFDLTEEELNPPTEEILIKKPQMHLRNESMIYDLDPSLGIKDQRKYTGTDRNRVSFSGLLSSDYEHILETVGVDFTYMRRTERYSQLWWGLQFASHRTEFGAITQNPSGSTNPNSEAQNPRSDDAKSTVMAAGLGVGYRFKLLLDFFQTENAFENIDVYANGVELKESSSGLKYRGWGLTTNYGIHKRASTSFFYGGKLSYNLALVTREAIADESRSDRSLSLGWLTMGLELGFFF